MKLNKERRKKIMNTSGEAADQVVRMSLNSVEVAAKITGAGAKQIAVMLYAVMKDQKKTKGKMRLQSMLRSGKELKVFAVKKGDLQKFTVEAKRYGVLYCVLRDKNGNDGLTDIMVRAEDVSKINRIFDRFKFATVDTATIKSDIEKSKVTKDSEKQENERVIPEKSNEDKLIDKLMEKPKQKEQAQNQNPTTAQTKKSLQSEPTSKPKGNTDKGAFEPNRERTSV
ncbi:MAG: PcfB family protein, partial [Selenomonadaceae bacterium]